MMLPKAYTVGGHFLTGAQVREMYNDQEKWDPEE